MNQVFYHKMDLDGKCSAAIAKHYFDENGIECVLHPYNYDEDFPITIVTREDTIYFLDVVIQPYTKVEELINNGYRVIICDHHKSFLDTGIWNRAYGSNVDVAKAGCELTWEWFYPTGLMPKFVYYLGRYDTWDNADEERWENTITPFQYGMKNTDADPIHHYEIWETLFKDADESIMNKILEDGKLILKYQKKSYSGFCRSYSFDAVIQDYPTLKFICMNSPGGNSMMFDYFWDEEKYDGMIAYVFNGRWWNVSLYTTKDIDLSKIATGYGGGGHAAACGFKAKEVIAGHGEIKFVI